MIVDGQAVRSCSTPIADVQGKKVMTIEGLADNGHLHPIQQAFVRHDAFQCGFCTSGMILTAYDRTVQEPGTLSGGDRQPYG